MISRPTPLPLLVAAFAALALAGCAGAPDPGPDRGPDPEVIAAEQERKTEQETIEDRERKALFVNLDKMLDKYAQAASVSEFDRGEKLTESLDKLLRDVAYRYFDQIEASANDTRPEVRHNRAISLGALGFAEGDTSVDKTSDIRKEKALAALLAGARDSDPEIVNNAIFGLSVLRDPRTPPGVIAGVIENDAFTAAMRRGAAWALLQIQQTRTDAQPFLKVWRRQLEQPDVTDPGILVQALRGLGRTRDKDQADIVLPLLEHPQPLVRTAAAISVGYLKRRDTYEALLPLIETSETNANVRLAARKALQELAGGIDCRYNVRQWRKVFELDER